MQDSSQIVKYCGFNNNLSNDNILVSDCIVKIEETIRLIGQKPGNWSDLRQKLTRVQELLSGNSNRIHHYKLILLNEVICPYVEDMVARMILDPKRFSQMNIILEVVLDPYADNTHPSVALQELDKLQIEISRQFSIWPSKLSVKLKDTLQYLWKPILHDIKTDVVSISNKFIVIGLLDSIAKPLILLYPVWMILQQVVSITNQLQPPPPGRNGNAVVIPDVHTLLQLAPQLLRLPVLFQFLKAILLVMLASKLLTVLQLFQTSGIWCLLLGIILQACMWDVKTCKLAIPFLVPHLVLLNQIASHLHQLEDSMLHTLSMAPLNRPLTAEPPPGAAGPGNRNVTVDGTPRVEELSSRRHTITNTPAAAPAPAPASTTPSSRSSSSKSPRRTNNANATSSVSDKTIIDLTDLTDHHLRLSSQKHRKTVSDVGMDPLMNKEWSCVSCSTMNSYHDENCSVCYTHRSKGNYMHKR